MGESKHTPGPWKWRGKDGGLYREGDTHPYGEAVLVPSYEYDSGIDTIVSEADMALIAAAPDLLAALKSMPIRMNETDSNYLSAVTNWWHRTAYKAIAKAEGRS